MPCFKCSNGKWKYGENGNCQFDTLKACREAEQAIHARENQPKKQRKDMGCCHPDCQCPDCRRNRIK